MSNALSAIRAFDYLNPDVIDRLHIAYGDEKPVIDGVVMAELLSVITGTTVIATDWYNWQNIKSKSIAKNRIRHAVTNKRVSSRKPYYRLPLTRAAEIMGVTESAVSRALNLGTMKGRKKGSRWFTSKAAIEEYQDLPRTRKGPRSVGEFLSIAETAKELSLPERVVREMCTKGQLKADRSSKHGNWHIRHALVAKMKKKLP